jgi:hypothetical protein
MHAEMLEGEVYSVLFEKRYITNRDIWSGFSLPAPFLRIAKETALIHHSSGRYHDRQGSGAETGSYGCALEQTVESIAIIQTMGKSSTSTGL